MKIAVNTRLLLKDKLEGIGWFSYEILKRITKSHPEHDFVFVFDRPFDKDFLFEINIAAQVLSPPTRHPFLWYIWFEIRLPFLLRKLKPDIFLSLDGYIPLNSNIPSVNVIHDINFLHRPADLPYFSRKFYNHFFPLYAEKAKALLTVSDFSKKDIAENYHIKEDEIGVVYNGIKNEFRPLTSREIKNFRQSFSDSLPYLFSLGPFIQGRMLNHFSVLMIYSGQNLNMISAYLLLVKKCLWQKIFEEYIPKCYSKKMLCSPDAYHQKSYLRLLLPLLPWYLFLSMKVSGSLL
jgi:glycosyltransferase involved in cell wall biosynthesis